MLIKIKCIAGSDILLHFDIHIINDIRQTTLEFPLFQEFNPDARIEKMTHVFDQSDVVVLSMAFVS